MPLVFSSSDRVLAARIEAAEAENLMALTRALQATQLDAALEPFAGGMAIFAGIGSPMTHAVGIGMQRNVPEPELERMEGFFREHKSPCVIDLCPLADNSVIAFVQSRPYRIIEFNNVLARRISADEAIATDSRVKAAEPEERDKFARLVLRGFSEHMPFDSASGNMGTARSMKYTELPRRCASRSSGDSGHI